MKKLIYSATILSALLLGACASGEVEETEAEEKVEEKTEAKEAKAPKEKKADIDYSALDSENISAAIIKALGDTTDQDKDRIIKVEITDKNYVFVHANADKALDARTILIDANKAFKEFKKFESAEQLNIFWYGTAIDDKGNEKEIEIVKTGFTRETIDTIDFEKFPIESYAKYSFPYFVHPSWEF